LLGNFGGNWVTFNSTIWSHCLELPFYIAKASIVIAYLLYNQNILRLWVMILQEHLGEKIHQNRRLERPTLYCPNSCVKNWSIIDVDKTAKMFYVIVP